VPQPAFFDAKVGHKWATQAAENSRNGEAAEALETAV
jgi:hypothetical protein